MKKKMDELLRSDNAHHDKQYLYRKLASQFIYSAKNTRSPIRIRSFVHNFINNEDVTDSSRYFTYGNYAYFHNFL